MCFVDVLFKGTENEHVVLVSVLLILLASGARAGRAAVAGEDVDLAVRRHAQHLPASRAQNALLRAAARKITSPASCHLHVFG